MKIFKYQHINRRIPQKPPSHVDFAIIQYLSKFTIFNNHTKALKTIHIRIYTQKSFARICSKYLRYLKNILKKYSGKIHYLHYKNSHEILTLVQNTNYIINIKKYIAQVVPKILNMSLLNQSHYQHQNLHSLNKTSIFYKELLKQVCQIFLEQFILFQASKMQLRKKKQPTTYLIQIFFYYWTQKNNSRVKTCVIKQIFYYCHKIIIYIIFIINNIG
eukprot:TRINITY_DN9051_c0_g1_i4.p1 TRINITY_DN9051_c0_g1~~TRINITY_DN9051_c0_g1_i4.p1  ORF type:complete len:217 (+),score=-21.52 TRINITY_DN9051_c0_g1_i4:390-1040(+)